MPSSSPFATLELSNEEDDEAAAPTPLVLTADDEKEEELEDFSITKRGFKLGKHLRTSLIPISHLNNHSFFFQIKLDKLY